MDIDAQAKYIYRMIAFMDRVEPMLLAYEAHIASEAASEVEADEAKKTEGSGTTDGVEGNTEEPAVEGTTETQTLETVAGDAPKAEETASEPAPVAEEPAPEIPAADAAVEEPVVQEEPAAETEEPKPAA